MMEFEDIYNDKRVDKLIDKCSRILYNEIVARDERYTESFKLSEAYKFFMEMREQLPEAEKCLLNIEKKHNGYDVTMIILDSDKEPIYKTEKAAYGKKITTKQLDRSVIEYMNGKSAKIMKKPE